MRIILFILALVIFSSNPAFAETVHKIDIRNNQRVEASTILSYLQIKEGDSFSQDKVNESLKEIFATELFANVDIRLEGSTLVVDVQENPIVNKIGFEGNKRISDDNLSSEVLLKPRSVYTKSKVQSDVLIIQDLYRKNGRYNATIEPKIVTLDQNRVDLVFEINEGKKASVKKIYFIGNKKFDSNTLRSELNTKESHWYSFYSSNDAYDPDRVSFDKELLRKFYTSKGYADFAVTGVTSEITQDKKSFILTFTLEEGEKYKFGDIKVNSALPDINIGSFPKAIKTEKGKVFNSAHIDDTVDNITNDLNNIGYAFVNVSPEYERDTKNQLMGIVYNIEEGPKVYIDKINITGNVRTLDKVIRREFRLSEGDPFNAAKIRRSQQRLQNLGFFDKVDVKSEQSDESDRANINVDILERPTGELNFGAGFSTADGLLGNVSVRERNLLGKGQDLKLSYQKSSYNDTIELNFTEPYFMDKDLATGFDLWNTTSSRSDNAVSSVNSTGGTLRTSYSLTELLRHTLRYSAHFDEISDIREDASARVKSQAGESLTSSVGHTLLYDKRDSKISPTDGYYIQLNQDVAGVGGDVNYLKNELFGGYFYPVYEEDVILKLTASGGYIMGYGDEDVRLADNFILNNRKVRGFKRSGFGPYDLASAGGASLGGKKYYAQSSELSFPVGLPDELGINGFVFNDLGAITDVDVTGPGIVDANKLHASAGIGVYWVSPLGPVNVSYAQPYMKERIDKTEKFQLDFGTRF